MATTGEVRVPMERYDVIVERWNFDPIKLSVPAFNQQDAIDRTVGEANRGSYYNFMKTYAPPPGSDRQEEDDRNRQSSSS